MFCCHNLLSEYTQRALLVLCALSREYRVAGLGVFRKDLVALTGLPARVVGRYVRVLLAHGFVGRERNRLVPGGRLPESTLYDLIVYMDGWVHLGNAHLEGVGGDAVLDSHLRRCEQALRGGLEEYLRSVRLSWLLPGGEVRAEASGVPASRFEGAGVN